MSPVTTDTERRIGVAILAKAPVPGFAKTRLIPHLGAEGAALLQRWLLQQTVAAALIADVGPVTLWCAPDMRHPEFATCRAYGPVTLRQQPDGDLGQRLWTAVAASPSPLGTLVIGTDCPVLTPHVLRKAAAALADKQAVMVPAEDGGYVLIGMREAARLPFSQVDWSTDRVLAQTRQRLEAQGWQWAELETLWDVDRMEDFERLLRLYPDARTLAPARVALT